jgi:hypothetical protein
MEKTGDFFNQIAIIADLLEKINLNATETSIVFFLNEIEFNNIADLVLKKTTLADKINSNQFIINIGEIEIIFNKNNA